MTTTQNTTPSEAIQAKHTASREEINRLAAELIGYRITKPNEMPSVFGHSWGVIHRTGYFIGAYKTEKEAIERLSRQADFCSPDCPASLTAQLLAKVREKQGGTWDFQDFLPIHSSAVLGGTAKTWRALYCTPMAVCIACLRALGVFPDEWEVPTE